ncbi:hypothetical protein F4775DRAFT_540456 [Biscogniauxia sp. FL1348]|nr:hypothetical protein F4775DRAFT_540456 [Biscogniauxia sp. FL1348]
MHPPNTHNACENKTEEGGKERNSTHSIPSDQFPLSQPAPAAPCHITLPIPFPSPPTFRFKRRTHSSPFTPATFRSPATPSSTAPSAHPSPDPHPGPGPLGPHASPRISFRLPSPFHPSSSSFPSSRPSFLSSSFYLSPSPPTPPTPPPHPRPALSAAVPRATRTASSPSACRPGAG